MEVDQSKIWLYDIETLAELFMLEAKRVGQDTWKQFVVSPYENSLDAMIKWLREENIEYLCGFNCNSFDMQVIQYILDSHDRWFDLSNQEIIDKIYRFAQDLISNQNYDIQPPYKEEFFDIKQIDLMSIHGYTNENKRVSLKWIEYMTDMVVDEMPIEHSQRNLTPEHCQIIKDYCKNDILATEKLYEYTRGNSDNILYKGKDKIQERLDTIEEFKLKASCINYSDVRIGETINLKGYMEEAGIKSMAALYEKKKNRGAAMKFTFGQCIPKYVKFQLPELQQFHAIMKKEPVDLSKKKDYPVTLKGMEYTIAKGGLHSVNHPVILVTTEEYELIEFDVSSQYPASLIKRELYPSHLGISWLRNYKKLVDIRLDAKSRGKKEPRYKGIAESLKLAVNGGGFGKTNDTYSLQYDPFVHFQCTIGNQFEILMLIDWLIVAGINILSANTDGALCGVPVSKKEEFYRLCSEWEKTVGNTVTGQLEYTMYSKYVMLTVNDYIAIKSNGELKQKGDFLTDHELNKNKSRRIIPIALTEYYTKGTPVEETIKGWKSIWEFGIAKKASRDYYYKGIDKKTGNSQEYNKLIRYYCSKGIGEKLYKCKHEHSEKTGPKISQIESSSDTQVLFNKPIEYTDISELKIDYRWYITQAYGIIDQLEREKGRDRKEAEKGLLSLFG